ncbi:MAG: hypothetical protein NTW19_17835 [Planctomycetota bacterium]|nr:hypothetical protein [Planctomycetota bacterium]
MGTALSRTGVAGLGRRAQGLRAHSRRARGMTAVELAVALVVTGALVVVLIPVVEKGRAAQRSATCTSQLRTMYQAVMNYTQDYNNSGPHRSPSTVTGFDGQYDSAGNSVAFARDFLAGPFIYGACGDKKTGSALAYGPKGHGQLIEPGYAQYSNFFCPGESRLYPNAEDQSASGVDSANRRAFWKRPWLFGQPYTTVSTHANFAAMPGYDGIAEPDSANDFTPLPSGQWYIRSTYTYTGGDWSYSASVGATVGVARSSPAYLRPDTDGFSTRPIVMDARYWQHADYRPLNREITGLVNVAWGDGTVFARASPQYIYWYWSNPANPFKYIGNGTTTPSAAGIASRGNGTPSPGVAWGQQDCVNFDKVNLLGRWATQSNP